jgi:hypothetical protein
VATSRGKFQKFQHNLISSVSFRAYCRCSSRCRILAILVSRKACVAYFSKVRALHRGELRFARYDLANRGRWNVPYAKGSFSDRDSGLTGGALDDPEVARCSWSNPLA